MAGQGASGSSEPGKDPQTGIQAAKDAAKDAARGVKQEASSFADAAQDKAEQKITEKKGAASDAMGDFANAVRRAGDDLSKNDRPSAARMVQQAADELENLSRAVSQKRPEELLQAVRDFGRENPSAFVAGSVLAGFALGRFLRASDKPRQDDQDKAAGHPSGDHGDAEEVTHALGRDPRSGDLGATGPEA